MRKLIYQKTLSKKDPRQIAASERICDVEVDHFPKSLVIDVGEALHSIRQGLFLPRLTARIRHAMLVGRMA
jgi:hypothetical protein